MKSPYKGIKRILFAGKNSLNGLVSTYREEEAFRQEVWLFVALTPVAFWLGKTAWDIAILLGVLVFVMLVELLNSALETAVDRIGEEYNELSGRAKDQASAAVLLSFVIAIGVWGGFLLERFL
ncbi:diacylglycerol kinase [Hydrogenovibrio kuenenii]|uniref:diacylglycerol kinase n=1 Tax=Hydrogenovibrio kuenenii TaxID=63658 RepID=UPI000465600E|nr:diacylglycerol kinase [Hydrogenovibrio kuenenii]